MNDEVIFINDMVVAEPNKISFGIIPVIESINLHTSLTTLMEMYLEEGNISDDDAVQLTRTITLLGDEVDPSTLEIIMLMEGYLTTYHTDVQSVVMYSNSINSMYDRTMKHVEECDAQ